MTPLALIALFVKFLCLPDAKPALSAPASGIFPARIVAESSGIARLNSPRFEPATVPLL